jgi:hypothetical protein
MQVQSFLQSGSSLSTAVTLAAPASVEPNREMVKLYIVGSLAGIAAITHSLHQKRFAEVREWSHPQATGRPGEYISVLFRHILLA